MVKLIKLNLVIAIIFSFVSCTNFATSMSPKEVNKTLPTLTKAKFASPKAAEAAIKNNRCKYLVRGRTYVAPKKATVHGDLKYGAQGIDDWVEIDGGNAYVLISYKWVVVDNNGSTQLNLEFDTMLCE